MLIAYIALASVCLIWGTTYLALRIAVLHFPPFLFIALRQGTAGLVILAFVFLVNRIAWPSYSVLFKQAIAGFFMISMGNGLVAWAEVYIPSGIAAIICSLMPALVILINLSINREEKPNLFIIIGVALGLSGIVLIFSEYIFEFSRPEYLAGIFLTFVAVLAWAGGSIWIKKRNTESNLYLNAGLQIFFGGVLLLPISLLFDDYNTISWSAEVIYPLLYLTIFGSIIAYICYSYALRKLPMTIVSLYAYINPLVAVVLGWMVLDEKLNLKIIMAFLITVGGIYLVNKGYQQVKEWRPSLSKQ